MTSKEARRYIEGLEAEAERLKAEIDGLEDYDGQHHQLHAAREAALQLCELEVALRGYVYLCACVRLVDEQCGRRLRMFGESAETLRMGIYNADLDGATSVIGLMHQAMQERRGRVDGLRRTYTSLMRDIGEAKRIRGQMAGKV